MSPGMLVKFFFSVFMDQDGFGKNMEQGQHQAILMTEQAWPKKDFFVCAFQENISCWTQQVGPSRQDNSILPTRVANHRAEFDSSCPLMELAI